MLRIFKFIVYLPLILWYQVRRPFMAWHLNRTYKKHAALLKPTNYVEAGVVLGITLIEVYGAERAEIVIRARIASTPVVHPLEASALRCIQQYRKP